MSITVPPLTATFTPAPSCLTDYYIWNSTDIGSCIVGKSTQTCKFISLGPPSTSACLPSGYETATTAFFSPGVCPSGYSTACSEVVSVGTLTETRATCCPSGYSCQTETSGWPWYYDHACTQAPSSGEIWTYTSSTSGGWYTGTSMGGKGANAYGVAIRWQSTDFQATPTFASSTATTASQPADNTLSSTPDSSNHGTSSSASRGQLVGIGVGSSCGVLVLLALGSLLYCVIRRRRAKPAHNAEGPVMWRISPNEGSPSELQATEPAKEMYAPLRQLPPVELPAGEPEITEISNVRGDRYA